MPSIVSKSGNQNPKNQQSNVRGPETKNKPSSDGVSSMKFPVSYFCQNLSNEPADLRSELKKLPCELLRGLDMFYYHQQADVFFIVIICSWYQQQCLKRKSQPAIFMVHNIFCCQLKDCRCHLPTTCLFDLWNN